MKDDQSRFDNLSRRGFMKYFAGVVTGWFITTFLTPIKRWVVSLIAKTPLGRRAKVVFGYTDYCKGELSDYTMQIANSGGESAENVTIHIGYYERIRSVTPVSFSNIAPHPKVEIEISEGGICELYIETLRRDSHDHFNPLYLNFDIEEGTTSSKSFKLSEDDVASISYRYSWTFLGERFWESRTEQLTR